MQERTPILEIKRQGEFGFFVDIQYTGRIVYDLTVAFWIDGNRPVSYRKEETLTEYPKRENAERLFKKIKTEVEERFPEGNSYHERIFRYLNQAEEALKNLHFDKEGLSGKGIV